MKQGMAQQGITSLVIPVCEAESRIQVFRTEYLHTPGVTMPPHVTVHVPFKHTQEVDEGVLNDLGDLFASHVKFRFVLRKTGRFPSMGVLYLEPEPAAPFHNLSQAIRLRYPDAMPDFADPVMHLTLARCRSRELDKVEEAFYQACGDVLPIETTATEVCLFERCDNRWHKRALFALSEG